MEEQSKYEKDVIEVAERTIIEIEIKNTTRKEIIARIEKELGFTDDTVFESIYLRGLSTVVVWQKNSNENQ
jgi:hypothetical protein